jgi:hypothetical protein
MELNEGDYYIAVSGQVTDSVISSIGTAIRENEKAKIRLDMEKVNIISSFRIPDGAFQDCENLTSIVIPKEIKVIESMAFAGCINLTEIPITENLDSIKNGVFAGCKGLLSVDLTQKISYVSSSAFYACSNLKEINVAKGNRYYSSFNGVLMNQDKTIIVVVPSGKHGIFEIPNTVKEVESFAFKSCNLDEIKVQVGNEYLSVTDNVIFNKDGIILITCPSNKVGVYSVPKGVVDISNYAFLYCKKITSVMLPDGVKNIRDCAFYNCDGLVDINIPYGVETIGAFAFYNCSSLETITIPESVESIGNHCFNKCSNLTSAVIPQSVKHIGYNIFWFCDKLEGYKDEGMKRIYIDK